MMRRPHSRWFPVKSLRPVQTARAVTLVELLVVVFIAGLIATVAIPLSSSQSGFELEGAARRIMADIRYVQSQAMNKRAPQAIVFDPDNGFYYHPSQADFDVPATEQISKKPYLIVLRDNDGQKDDGVWEQSHAAEFPSVNLDSADFDEEEELYFDDLGFPTDGDGQALTGVSISISSGQSSRTITVDVSSGQVTIN